MDRYRASIECSRVFIHLEQQPCESTHEYYERFRWYLDEYPYHNLHSDVLLDHFVDGMIPDERYILDDMAGTWIMNCNPSYIWYLIETRAENTRPCEFSPEFMHEVSEVFGSVEKVCSMVEEMSKNWEERNKKIEELRSTPELTRFSVDDEEVTLLTEEQAVEETMEEELQVIPTTNVEDVPTEEWNSPQSSDLIIKQDTVITCSPITSPISDILVSSHVQNDTIPKALRNNQVWGSLEKFTFYIPMLRNPTMMQTSEQFTEGLCINWKTRKKGMRGSPEDTNTHVVWAQRQTQKQEKIHEALRRTWKNRKRGKRIFVNFKCPMFFEFLQESHCSTFGWKPGWNTWRSMSQEVTRNGRKAVRKFDGVHPWAPNIY